MTKGDRIRATPEQLTKMLDLLPTAHSLRELAAAVGLNPQILRREIAPFLAVMKLNGTHPQCGCGRDRFHQWGCADSARKGFRNSLVPGRSPVAAAIQLAQREAVVALLIEGKRFAAIDRELGLSPTTARWYLRYLTDDQRQERERRMQERSSKEPAR